VDDNSRAAPVNAGAEGARHAVGARKPLADKYVKPISPDLRERLGDHGRIHWAKQTCDFLAVVEEDQRGPHLHCGVP